MRTGTLGGRAASGTLSRAAALLAASLGVSACNETASDMGLAVSQTRVMAPSGMPIAVESLSGGPEALRTKFAGALSQEASQRRIELVGAGAAPRYRIRGYLDAGPGEDGKIAFSFVWDVYDTANRRAKRVEGAAQVRGSASDPWSAVDEPALRAVAAQSMNEIAGFLVAAGPAEAGTRVAAVRPASAKPLAYAPVED
jgi:hypothetical protein